MTNRIFPNTLFLASAMGLIFSNCETDDRPKANTEASSKSEQESTENSSSDPSDKSDKESEADDDDSDSGDEETEVTPNYIIEEDFEDYDVDSPMAEQAGDPWTTWMHNPGDATDPVVSDKEANGGKKALLITSNDDLVAQLGLLEEGKYKISFQIFIEEEKLGYFNFLQVFWTEEEAMPGVDPSTICKWGADITFNPDGNGNITAAGESTAFEFEHEQWIQISATIDIDEDIGRFSINGEEIADWTWSSGTQGGDNSPTLGGVNFYGPAMQADGTPIESSYLVDDFSIEKVESTDSDDDDDDDKTPDEED